MNRSILAIVLPTALSLVAFAATSFADTPLGTAFTYQGRLNDGGAPANGTYDLVFFLFDAAVGGNQEGPFMGPVAVSVSDGSFSTELDFGIVPFNGSARWLEVWVEGTPLSPRQPLTAAPYALQTRGILVDDAGRVGIGLSTPVAKLNVESATTSAGDNTAKFSAPSLGPRASHIHYGTKGDWYIRSSDATGKVVLQDGGGNVGIGTPSPGARMSVYENAESTTQTNFTTALASAGINIVTDYTADAFTPGLFWSTQNNNSTKPKAGIYMQETGTGSRLYLGTSNNYSAGITNDAVVITESGDVGVGIASPFAKLHVTAPSSGTVDTAIYGSVGCAGSKGVWGSGSCGRYGVYGSSASIAVFSQGDFGGSGGKYFRIDHPFDPENKYLNHQCAEGPEPLLFYRGNVTLDGTGKGQVDLPDYFEAINRDFHYHLTPIGGAAPNLHVAQKVIDNSFRIAGGTPGLEVSWTVTGVRNDPYMQQRARPVVEDKPGHERGKYQHPELYGRPPEMGMDYDASQME